MKRVALPALVLLAGCGGSAAPSKPAAAPTAAPAEPVVDAPCRPPRDPSVRDLAGTELVIEGVRLAR